LSSFTFQTNLPHHNIDNTLTKFLFHHDRWDPMGTADGLPTTSKSASPPHRHIIHKTTDRPNVDFKKHMLAPDVAFYLHGPKFTYIPFIFNNLTFVPTFVQ
jgi:hypothetical protein